MANHRGAAGLLLIASLIVAVALSGAHGRPTVRPDVMPTGGNTVDTVRRDADGDMAVDAAAAVDPECDGDDDGDDDDDGDEGEQQGHSGGTGQNPGHTGGTSHNPGRPGGTSQNNPGNGGTQPDSMESELDQEQCSTCEEPKKKEPPPCSTCEEPKKQPELSCNEVHAVQEGETCDSMVECAELDQDDFLRFNPNICCEKLFVGQWVCLDATCAA